MRDGRPALPSLPALRAPDGQVAVVVVGPAYLDVVFTGLPRPPHEGEELWATGCVLVPGGCYITALALHRLGASTAWATALGEDPFSALVAAAARSEGMDERAFQTRTGDLVNVSVALSYGAERSFVSHEGAPAGGLLTEDVVAAIRELEPQVVVWPGLPMRDTRLLVQAAREVGARIFLDPQDTPLDVGSPELVELLGEVDLFAPNERELRRIAREDDSEGALRTLLDLTPRVVVKCGARGAALADRQGHAEAPAFPVQVVETTGAGDCFNAGFVIAWLEGGSVEQCLRTGNAAGGLSTCAPSSTGIPQRGQVDSLLDSTPAAP